MNENKTNAPIQLPVRLIYVDNILSDTHQIVDVNGKRVSKRAIVTALNEADALRAEVEGLRTYADILLAHTMKDGHIDLQPEVTGRPFDALWRESDGTWWLRSLGADIRFKTALEAYAAIKPNAAAGGE